LSDTLFEFPEIRQFLRGRPCELPKTIARPSGQVNAETGLAASDFSAVSGKAWALHTDTDPAHLRSYCSISGHYRFASWNVATQHAFRPNHMKSLRRAAAQAGMYGVEG
jgi:hypothetical protein